jgi:hypothetical protein
MDWQAMSTAVKLLEHAVSTWTLGPCKSKYLAKSGLVIAF